MTTPEATGSLHDRLSELEGFLDNHCNRTGAATVAEAKASLAARSFLAERLAKALQPFAAVAPNVLNMGNVRPESLYLWKPSNNRKELPGISAAHVRAAADALAADQAREGGGKK